VGQARFIFSRVWLGTPTAVPDQETLTPARWRLVSGNNRLLGRSAEVFDDIDLARAAAERLQAALPLADPIVVRLTSPARWVWSLVLDGGVCAVSGRGYEMERVALHSLDLFLAGAALAPVGAVGVRTS
jgi:hypothetical protein